MCSRQIRVVGELAYVQLTMGYEAVIDAADIQLVEGFNWRALVDRRKDKSVRNVYAFRVHTVSRGVKKTVYMHRVIAGTPDGMDTDHIDGNGLNNIRLNLRAVTKAQNQHNQRPRSGNHAGLKGISYHRQTGKWRSQISAYGQRRYLGFFESVEDAAKAYEAAKHEMHGDFGWSSE